MAESSLRYEGKVTIVTGGAGGIGKGIVERFVRQGSKVVFCDLKEEEGKTLEESLNAEKKGEAKFVKCDVTYESELKNLVEKTIDSFGQIDCVVCVAGYHPPVMTIDEVDSDSFLQIIKLNLFHPVLLAKGAITALVRTLAIDESKFGVRVNSVSPGVIDTPLTQMFMNTCGFDDPEGYFKSFSVLNRMGTVEEVANACLYLATEGTFCTGIDLKTSGGTELGFSPKVR